MPHASEVCEAAARTAGRILREMLGKITVRHKKNPFDLLTEADLAAQRAIEEIVLGAFPEHQFIGEEGCSGGDSEHRWFVDPLDGTTNFVHGVPLFTTSIALAKGEELLCGVIYNPVTEEFYSAERGKGAFLNGKRIRTSSVQRLCESLVAVNFPTQTTSDSPDLVTFLKAIPVVQAIRRTGSMALNLAFVAVGRFDTTWGFTPHPWDVAAGTLLVQEAGGIVTHPDGSLFRLDDPASICATASPVLHDVALQLLSPTHSSSAKALCRNIGP